METQHSVFYEAPTIRVLEVIIEGVFCQSGGAGVENYSWEEFPEE